MKVEINTLENSKHVSSILHDARFVIEGINLDKQKQTFDLKCWQLERIPKIDKPSWKAYHLNFTGLKDFKFEMAEKVSYYELATMRFSERDGLLNLITHYGVEIVLTLEKLSGWLVGAEEIKTDW